MAQPECLLADMHRLQFRYSVAPTKKGLTADLQRKTSRKPPRVTEGAMRHKTLLQTGS